MKQPKKRKRGGQPKPAAERKRNNVTIRLIDDLRAKLEAASRASGRSLSEEAAWRLTMSFMFNQEIQEVAQVQRGLGDVMVEILTKSGWAIGDELRRNIDPLFSHDQLPIFMPPEHQQLLKERTQRLQPDDKRRSEGGGDIDLPHRARLSDAGTGAENGK